MFMIRLLSRCHAFLFAAGVVGCAAAQTQQFERPFRRGSVPMWANNAVVSPPSNGAPAELLGIDEFGLWRFMTGGASTVLQDSAAARRRAVIADVNGDGSLDVMLCALADGDSSASVGINHAAPGQGAQCSRAAMPDVTLSCRGAALGDVDGDADLDLIVSSKYLSGGEGVHVLTFGGAGFIERSGRVPTGSAPAYWVTLGDDDGDGDLDLFLSSLVGPPQWWTNDGAGTFADATASLPPVSGSHAQHIGADLDGDGRADIALLSTTGDLQLLWGTAAGWTASTGPSTVPLVGPAPVGADHLEVCDLDGDGLCELVGWNDLGFVVLRQPTPRQFVIAERVVEQLGVRAVSVGDLDGDSRDEIRITADVDTVLTWWGAQRLMTDPLAAPGLQRPFSAADIGTPAFGDIDGDGRMDGVAPMAGGVEVQRSRGHGLFEREQQQLAVASEAGVTLLGDVDGDGDLDLVRDTGTELHVFSNDGAGRFAELFTMSVSRLWDVELECGDVDGDGSVEILRIISGHLRVIHVTAGGPVITTVPLSRGLLYESAIELADMDGDQDLDLVMTSVRPGIEIVVNDGNGVFTERPALGIVHSAPIGPITAADVDGDGDVDLLVRSYPSPVLLFENDGVGQLTDATVRRLPLLPSIGAWGAVIAEDFDGDGDVDVYSQPHLLLYDGARFVDSTTGHWSDPGCCPVGESTAVDLDNDGDLDIAGVSGWPGGFEVRINNLRQLMVSDQLRPGVATDVQLLSGPGFGPSGTGLVVASLAPAATPLSIPGLAGKVEVDPQSAVVLSASLLSSVGRSRTFLTMPNNAALVGTELFFQGVILSSGPQENGVTNALRDVVLP